MAKIAILSFYSGLVERGAETFVYELSKRLVPKHNIVIFQAGEKIANPNIRTCQVKAFGSKPKSGKNFLSKIYLDWQSLKILIMNFLMIK